MGSGIALKKKKAILLDGTNDGGFAKQVQVIERRFLENIHPPQVFGVKVHGAIVLNLISMHPFPLRLTPRFGGFNQETLTPSASVAVEIMKVSLAVRA